ncbi:PREDICTED: N-alpha-acetyltransferase 38, NatC auxiliary subunit-like [Priapulus caudatus]|uniref:N-alpha-acetyltransferase 38, NatC auxiliary subunit-like n=1 Tax=Priapulus caudatus TaxID=37621 RepID=A0ABM1E9R4_PRICU|nr:PREDICTED: N-alpha-acetyltransferase 38, NatC auxiliary subunit-like [Priapulus caudatus]
MTGPTYNENQDVRSLIGSFLCTDKDANLILGNCQEYIYPPEMEPKEEPRALGLAMIPGHHIVSVHLDKVTEDEPRIQVI